MQAYANSWSAGKRKVAKLEADLDRIFHLSHPRLLSVVGYRIVRYSPGFFPLNPALLPSIRSGEGWTLLVVTPPNRSQSLDELLSTVGELRPDRALAYFAQLVSAVEALHSHHVVHRAIRPKTIFVTSEKSRSDSSEAAGVRLVGAGWYRRILDLNRAEPWLQQPAEEELPDGW